MVTFQSSLHSSSLNPQSSSSRPSSPPKKMSISQTYFLAHKARAKLSNEAARPDHNLRLLVGHANLLDSLMLDLAEAEREQESWFNQQVRSASPKTEERHIQWADTIPEQTEWEVDDSDSDSDSDSDEEVEDDEDVEMADAVSLRRVPAHTETMIAQTQAMEEDEDEDDDYEDDDEDYASLSLTRSPSHSASPPELDHDSDSSDDESMPPSPEFATVPTFSEKQEEAVAAYLDSRQDAEDGKIDFYDAGYMIPTRNPARLISAISVY